MCPPWNLADQVYLDGSSAADAQETGVACGGAGEEQIARRRQEMGGEDEVMYRPETKTPAQGRGGFFVVFAKSRKLSLIGAQCQPVH
ncbi:hypothetical protein AO063_00780 [Pseudomonas fluorescens ICMP 11288]|uniref:Uncharacterized protein n=1 Tax=Pseudomonas fluorescens ICMP 11288 TaxID=1198309 RepID=A0A0W0I609_PSEFL|nr:hypothetical protein AO063_00780 [Pseudomonas fluorescens ICMP 11288]